MTTSTAWIGEFLQQRTGGQKGNLAQLREIAERGRSGEVAGVVLAPEVARVLMQVYDRITPHDQELFAANCNLDFANWVNHCLKSLAALATPAAQVTVMTVTK